jgi:hypothetical protein
LRGNAARMMAIAATMALVASYSSERPAVRPQAAASPPLPQADASAGPGAPPSSPPHVLRERAQRSIAPTARLGRPVYNPSGGVELWGVKTASDPFARYIDPAPRETTIPQLVALRHPHREANARINGAETTTGS